MMREKEYTQRKNFKIARMLSLTVAFVLFMTTLAGCGAEQPNVSGMSTSNNVVSSAGSVGQAGNDGTGGAGGAQSGSSSVISGLGDNAAADQLIIKEAFKRNSGKVPTWVGIQVYNGEVVNVFRMKNGSEDEQKALDIFLYDYDGNGTFIAKGVPNTENEWFYTREGVSICVGISRLRGYDSEGTEQFDFSVEGAISSMIQLNDGRLVALMKTADSSYGLGVLDLEEKSCKMVPGVSLGKDRRLYISPGEEGVIVLNSKGFWDVNLTTGEMTERLPLEEYNLELDNTLKSFRLLEGGTLELLYQNKTEVLMPINIEKYRTIITMQYVGQLHVVNESLSFWTIDQSLSLMLDEFNKTNTKYYVDTVGTDSQEENYSALLKGNGGDVVCANFLNDTDLQEAIRNGCFVDLSDYMAASHIYEEDYFPGTFTDFKYQDGIYGAASLLNTYGLAFQESVLGGRDIRNLEDLLDALLANVEPSVFHQPAGTMLYELLRASDSVGGTVDWGNRTCDFSGNLFIKLLEVCHLYDNTGNDQLPVISQRVSTEDFYGYLNEEQRKLAGEVYLGYFFDDGLYPLGKTGNVTVLMNSHSENKEGAWEVIAWLLSEGAQDQNDFTLHHYMRGIPSNIYAFETVVEKEQEESAIGQFYNSPTKSNMAFRKNQVFTLVDGQYVASDADLTDEEYCALYNLKDQDVEEMRALLYNAQPAPLRTKPILDIIYEETVEYFSGERNLSDTCDAIQKRVQEYLDRLK